MRVFIDTNILIDYLLDRGDNTKIAVRLLKYSYEHSLEILVCDLTIANISYITRKDIPRSQFYDIMNRVSKFFTIVPMGENVIKSALEAQWKDFEDSLQYFSAIQANANCIITRNVKDFQEQGIPIFTPSEFLSGYNILQ